MIKRFESFIINTLSFTTTRNVRKSTVIVTAAIAVIVFTGSRTALNKSPATAAAATLTPAFATRLLEYAVYIYDPVTGEPDEVGNDSYTSGHVYDGEDGLIGSVPNPSTDGHIYDNDNNKVGLIAPSPAAIAELP